MNPALASQLCVQCAICCDGTLFSRAPLSADEARVLQERGFELLWRPDGHCFLPLGCQGLEGCRCARYDVRPGACRSFRCGLCAEVEAERLPLAQALEVVEEAKRLRRKAFDREFEEFLARHFHRVQG